jgi:hypothetical protein
MWKLIKAELSYNWIPLAIGFTLITALMTAIFLAGEDNWYGPSGMYGMAIVFAIGAINVASRREKRLFSLPFLPVKHNTRAKARALMYVMLISLANLIPLLLAFLLSPGILTQVTFGRYFLVAGALLAINGSYLVATDAGSMFDGKRAVLKFFGVVGLIIIANSIFYTLIVIEMPKRYGGIVQLLGLEGKEEEILRAIYSLEAGLGLVLLGLLFFVASYFTFKLRKRFITK